MLRETVAVVCVWYTLLFSTGFGNSSERGSKDVEDFQTFFELGVKAYNYQVWNECQEFMVEAITSYHEWENLVADCRKKCSELERLSNDTGIETELKIIDKVFRTSACAQSCKHVGAVGKRKMPDLSKTDFSKFDTLEPYNYLQLCAYKTGRVEQAVASAYTYFLHNPHHDVMKQNLIDYRGHPQVSDTFFKDLERRIHQIHYMHGIKSYHEGLWLLVIDYMVRGVEAFYRAVEQCEYVCEERYSVISEQEKVNSVPEHYVNVLKCKQRCDRIMSRYHEKIIDNMAADYYHYLQFAYYQVKDIEKAYECVANYLLLNPADKVMASNKLYYFKKYSAKEEDFKPSQRAIKYYRHKKQIASLLEDYENSKVTTRVDVIPSTSSTPPYQPAQVADDDRDTTPVIEEYKERGITVTYNETDLNGPQRVVADGFATEEMCQNLIKLANLGNLNDGYDIQDGRQSPHTLHERFVGMTVNAAEKLVMNEEISADIAQQYLDVTQLSREFTMKYFGLDNLYFDFTHLVCRTSLDEDKTRKDLSHPIHADNCIIQKDGSCKRDFPAYVERDFSALLYLNDDFEGGDFFFAHQNLSASATVRPKCGRIVAFNATNYHGVKAVISGQRCAVAIWYTLDERYKEVSHVQAQTYLDALKKEHEAASVHRPEGPPVGSPWVQRSESSHSAGQSSQSAVTDVKEEL